MMAGPGGRCARPAADAMGPVLVGMRGAGKSSLAPRVATALEMDALDADTELQLREGMSVAEIFARRGEAVFRRIERALLLDDLLRRPRVVLATGGGAILDAEVRAVLRQRFTVWLTAPLACLARRVARHPTDRPSLTGQPPDLELARVLAHREPLYRQVARLTIDTDALALDAAAAAIATAMRATERRLEEGPRG